MITQYLLSALIPQHLLSKPLNFHEAITYLPLPPCLTWGENTHILNTVKHSGLMWNRERQRYVGKDYPRPWTAVLYLRGTTKRMEGARLPSSMSTVPIQYISNHYQTANSPCKYNLIYESLCCFGWLTSMQICAETRSGLLLSQWVTATLIKMVAFSTGFVLTDVTAQRVDWWEVDGNPNVCRSVNRKGQNVACSVTRTSKMKQRKILLFLVAIITVEIES